MSCDPSRIKKLLTLKPKKAYVGSGEFNGYIVFIFDTFKGAILECAWKGNALYILNENWTQLSKLSKGDLLQLPDSKARRNIQCDTGRVSGAKPLKDFLDKLLVSASKEEGTPTP